MHDTHNRTGAENVAELTLTPHQALIIILFFSSLLAIAAQQSKHQVNALPQRHHRH